MVRRVLRLPLFDAFRTRHGFAFLIMSVLSTLAISGLAQAEETDDSGPQFVDFVYQAAPECMDEDGAFSLVHRRSRRVMRARDSTAPQRLDMEVKRSGNGYRGLLTVRRTGQDAEKRSMTGATCDEVVEALALTAALSIDPHATLTLGPVDQEAETRPALRPEETTTVAVQPDADEQAAHVPLELTLGPSISVEKVMDHTAHVGGGLVLSLSRPNQDVFFPLETRLSVHAFGQLSKSPEPGINVQMFLARLAYCPVRFGSDFSLLFCSSGELGVLSAKSRGVVEPQRATRLAATLGGEAWLRAKVAQSAQLWLSPAVMAPLTKRQFAVQPGPEVLASTVSVAWSVSSGLGWTF